MAAENIAEGETRTGTGTETGSMGTGIGNVIATGIESAPRDETIGEETMVVVAASASVVGAVRGTLRNIDGMTIGAESLNVMTSADIVVGAKTVRLLVEAIEDARGQVADSRGVCDAVAAQTQGFWMGRPCTGVRAVLCYASETNW